MDERCKNCKPSCCDRRQFNPIFLAKNLNGKLGHTTREYDIVTTKCYRCDCKKPEPMELNK